MKKAVKSYGLITLGCLLYALAYAWFIAPNRFALGGVTGLAQVFHYFCPPLTVGLASIAMNVPLFAAGWRKLGGRMLVSSLYAMLATSLAMDLFALYDFPPWTRFWAACTAARPWGWARG